MFFKFFVAFFLCWFVNQGYALPSLLVADTDTGVVLEAKRADTLKYPASLTKIMTLYLTFEALNSGILSMDDKLPISEKASKQPRSKIYLKAGGTITVREAVLALIIKSANDAAVVLAEALAPSEEDFALIMTSVAQDLGMYKTVFKNASGLHHPEQMTTARDLAILTMALIDHYPAYYKLFSTKSFVYNNKKYVNHNQLLSYYKGAEGLKTGFISAVGYNIISTAKRENHRLVSIVIGDTSVRGRNKKAAKLLDKGFYKIKNQGKNIALNGSISKKRSKISYPKREYYQALMKRRIDYARKLAMDFSQKNKLAVLEAQDGSVQVGQGDSDALWSIQVGAFSTQESAEKIAQHAHQILEKKGTMAHVSKIRNLFRSRVLGFRTKDAAEVACERMKQKNMNCIIISPSI